MKLSTDSEFCTKPFSVSKSGYSPKTRLSVPVMSETNKIKYRIMNQVPCHVGINRSK